MPKRTVKAPKPPTHHNIVSAGAAAEWPVREEQRHAARADRRRRAQEAQAPGAGPKNFGCENGQQRHRAAEQHREKVQRNGTQDNFCSSDIAQPRKDGFQAERLSRPRLGMKLDLRHEESCPRRGQHRGRVDRRWAFGNGVDQAAERRTQNRPALIHGTVPGDGILQMFFGDDLRQERAAHRIVERPHHSKQNHNGVHGQDRPESTQRIEEQQRRAHAKSSVAGHQQFSPVERVRRMPRDQKQQDARRELGQPHQAQVERPLRDFVDLPADRDRLHLEAGYDQKTSQLVKRKVRIREGNAPRV